ncbi:MAG: hypothetical protein A2V70_03515 [Planctomycetes bacterium RBG_13_63_9]|nr:MAG: hypothetical protein A2V70_03515 [Planctomycetes bacterium RBG_13_63_9]
MIQATITTTLTLRSADELLDQADHLLSEGFELAAGMLARSALEVFLRELCGSHGLEPDAKRGQYSISDGYLVALRRGRVLTKRVAREVARLWAIGSAVVHCDLDEPDAVRQLLADLRAFLGRVRP